MRALSLLLLPALLLVGGCEEKTSGFTVGTASKDCDLTLQTLSGSTWLMLEAMPDRSDRKNPMARMQWFEADGVQKVKYTVKSLGDVYTYDCKMHGEGKDAEWRCREEPRVQDWCQSLEAFEEGACTKEKLRELGAVDVSDEEMDKAIAAAKELAGKYRGGENWKQFQLNNNNLGNKLQGQLDAKLNAKQCNLRVSDMYMTIYNGEAKVDSNPVGTNPFAKADEGTEYLFEHCGDGRNLVDLDSAELPADLSTIPPQRTHALGGEVHYHYLGETAAKAEEGCTYSQDVYVQWEPVAKSVAVQATEDGKLQWGGSHKWESLNDQPVGVYTLIRHKQCGETREKIDVVCNAARIQ